ncbi:MAG: aldo/keto reductase [Chloroflexi bacterium]|nr:aldo/keto reductase [Chloroflexota bacterium]
MEYRNFGSAGVKVSPICLGTGFRGSPNDATCRATIERAIDHGVNFIDCANIYQGGRSERILGEVLKGRRDQFVITTKVNSPVGQGPNDRGQSRFHIMREIDKSLARLQTDYVDFYLVHQPDPTTPIEETLRALDDLVHGGKVRYIGCCNFAAWQVCKALWTSDRLHLTPFVGVQNPYSLLDRKLEQELMPFCRAEGLGMMTFSPLAVGLLTGRFRHGAPPPAGTPWGQGRPGFEEYMTPAADRVVETLIRTGAARGKTPAQVALAWVLSHPEISAVMLGPDSPEQVEENVGGAGWELAAGERAALDEVSAWAVTNGKS